MMIDQSKELGQEVVLESRNPPLKKVIERDLVHGELISRMLERNPERRVSADSAQSELIAHLRSNIWLQSERRTLEEALE